MRTIERMSVGDLCTREVVVTNGDLAVQDAARLMRDQHVGDLVIVERDDRGRAIPKAVITDRDLVVGVLALDLEHLPGLKMQDLVMAPVVTIPNDSSLTDAIVLMRANAVRRLPVVDHEGVLVGILTADDVYEALAEQLVIMSGLAPSQLQHERRVRR